MAIPPYPLQNILANRPVAEATEHPQAFTWLLCSFSKVWQKAYVSFLPSAFSSWDLYILSSPSAQQLAPALLYCQIKTQLGNRTLTSQLPPSPTNIFFPADSFIALLTSFLPLPPPLSPSLSFGSQATVPADLYLWLQWPLYLLGFLLP